MLAPQLSFFLLPDWPHHSEAHLLKFFPPRDQDWGPTSSLLDVVAWWSGFSVLTPGPAENRMGSHQPCFRLDSSEMAPASPSSRETGPSMKPTVKTTELAQDPHPEREVRVKASQLIVD